MSKSSRRKSPTSRDARRAAIKHKQAPPDCFAKLANLEKQVAHGLAELESMRIRFPA